MMLISMLLSRAYREARLTSLTVMSRLRPWTLLVVSEVGAAAGTFQAGGI
jgi:hypothetical protein